MAVLSGVHPVVEALRGNRPLDRVLIAQGAGGPRIEKRRGILPNARA